tara:strand:+ start:597 stop:3260 length:2664 start_codon:yes stop_codon:yes gene_type:complete
MKNFIITNIVLIALISCGGSTTEAPEVSIQTPEATIEVHATIDSGITARLDETPKLESTQTPQPKASDSTQPKNTIKINTSDEEKVNNQNNIESSQAGNFTLQCVSSTNDSLNTWVKTKGPIGGLGYNVRYRHDKPNIMYFTDAWSGIQKSTDGGQNWTQSNGEGEGVIDFRVGPSLDNIPVFALRIDPNDEDIIWIGLQDNGGLYKSYNGGQSWESKHNGLDSNKIIPQQKTQNSDEEDDTSELQLNVRMIEVEPGNSDVVYVMGDVDTQIDGFQFNRTRGFVFKSTDGGEQFELVGDFANLTRWLFFTNSNDTEELLVTTGLFDREPDTAAEKEYGEISDDAMPSGLGVGVFKSNDGGKNWYESNQGINPKRSMHFGGADQSPFDEKLIIIASGNDVDNFLRDYPGAIYKSIDGGASWQDVSPLYSGLGMFGAVAFAESDKNIVYVAGENEFLRSTDQGETWSIQEHWGPPGIKPGNPIDMVVSKTNPNIVFINNYGGGVFKTEDGGKTWIEWSNGYSGANIFGISVSRTGCLAANGRSQIHLSDDFGETWQGIQYGKSKSLGDGLAIKFLSHDDTNQTLIATDANNGRLYYSSNLGNDWEIATGLVNIEHSLFEEAFGIHIVEEAVSNPTVLYAGYIQSNIKGHDPHQLDEIEQSPGMYKSVDGGISWVPINNGLPNEDYSRNISDITVSSQNEDVVYINSLFDGLYYTVDGGEFWEHLTGKLPAGMSWDDCGHTCVNEDGQRIDMEDMEHSKMIQRKHAMSIAINPQNDQEIFLGTNVHGVYKSIDGGSSWEETLWRTEAINTSKRDHAHAIDIAINPIDTKIIAIADWNSGVLLSQDGGESWQRINQELDTGVVQVIIFSPNGQYLFAGTEGHGIFRYKLFD